MIENPTDEQLKSLKMIIYLITNKINNKNYVGQTIVTFNLRYRCRKWWKYINNKELKSDIKKYGKKNFKISILEHGIENEEQLNLKEDYYALKYDSYVPNGYNVMKCGIQSYPPSRTKTYKLKIYKTGEIITVTNINKFCRDNNFSLSGIRHIIDKTSLCSNGFTLPETILNPNSKQKIKLKKSYEFIDPFNNKIIINDLRKYCKENGLDLSHMLEIVKRKKKSYRFYSNPKNPIKFFHLINSKNEIFLLREGGGKDFAKRHNILPYMLKLLLREEKLVLGEWRLLKNKHLKPIFPYKALSPDGIVYEFLYPCRFARQNNLEPSSFSEMVKGRIKQYKGWVPV